MADGPSLDAGEHPDERHYRAGSFRQFEIDIATEPEGEPLGQVIVRHSKVPAFYKVPGIAFRPEHHHTIKDTTELMWTGGAREALGWRTE